MEEMIDKVLAIHDDEQRRAVIMRGNKVTWTAIAKKLGCPSRKQREAKQLEADGINENSLCTLQDQHNHPLDELPVGGARFVRPSSL